MGVDTYLVKAPKYPRNAVTKFSITSVTGDGAADDHHPLDGWGWNGSGREGFMVRSDDVCPHCLEFSGSYCI